jgi:RimJ/RimL family protein N-acetyltransferase
MTGPFDCLDPALVRLKTDRLALRPTNIADAPRAFEIQANWSVTSMLAGARFPPDREEAERWFASHQEEWRAGAAYRFAIEFEGMFIGMVDIESIHEGSGSLGYWIEPSSWGKGIATEAARAVISFGFEVIELRELRAGHAADNPASGKVLTRLGFRYVETVRIPSRSRDAEIEHCRYILPCTEWEKALDLL